MRYLIALILLGSRLVFGSSEFLSEVHRHKAAVFTDQQKRELTRMIFPLGRIWIDEGYLAHGSVEPADIVTDICDRLHEASAKALRWGVRASDAISALGGGSQFEAVLRETLEILEEVPVIPSGRHTDVAPVLYDLWSEKQAELPAEMQELSKISRDHVSELRRFFESYLWVIKTAAEKRAGGFTANDLAKAEAEAATILATVDEEPAPEPFSPFTQADDSTEDSFSGPSFTYDELIIPSSGTD